MMTLPELAKKKLKGQDPWQWLYDDIEESIEFSKSENELLPDVEWIEVHNE